jgi:ribosomal protein S27AE
MGRFIYWSLVTVIEGICPKCGRRSYGWALLQPRNQSCPKCGAGLLITEDGKKTIQGYSPFTAEEYKMKLPPGATPDPKLTKDNIVKE